MSLSSLCRPTIQRYQIRGCIYGACRAHVLLRGLPTTPASTVGFLRRRPADPSTRRAYIVKCTLQQEATSTLRTLSTASSDHGNGAHGRSTNVMSPSLCIAARSTVPRLCVSITFKFHLLSHSLYWRHDLYKPLQHIQSTNLNCLQTAAALDLQWQGCNSANTAMHYPTSSCKFH